MVKSSPLLKPPLEVVYCGGHKVCYSRRPTIAVSKPSLLVTDKRSPLKAERTATWTRENKKAKKKEPPLGL